MKVSPRRPVRSSMPSSKSPLVSHRQPVPSLPVRSNPRSPALGQRNRNGSGQEEEANGPNGISRQKKKQQTASRSSLSTGIQFRLVPFPQFAPHRCVIDRQLEGEAPATDAERSSPSRRRFQGRRRSLVCFFLSFVSALTNRRWSRVEAAPPPPPPPCETATPGDVDDRRHGRRRRRRDAPPAAASLGSAGVAVRPAGRNALVAAVRLRSVHSFAMFHPNE